MFCFVLDFVVLLLFCFAVVITTYLVQLLPRPRRGDDVRIVTVQGRLGDTPGPADGVAWVKPIQLADLPEAVAELGAHEDVDDELGEAVAEAEPHAVEVDLLGNVLVTPASHALRHADDGEGQPRDEEHGRDDEADVVVPGALREVLVHTLQQREEEPQI